MMNSFISTFSVVNVRLVFLLILLAPYLCLGLESAENIKHLQTTIDKTSAKERAAIGSRSLGSKTPGKCKITELRGSTYQGPIEVGSKTYCFKLELDIGGILEAKAASNPLDCASETFSKSLKISTIQSGSASEITLKAAKGKYGYKGEIFVSEDASIREPEMRVEQGFSDPQGYILNLVLPSCNIPRCLPRGPFSPNTLPGKHFVWDLMLLSDAIYNVGDIDTAQGSVDNLFEDQADKEFKVVDWIEPPYSVEAMIVTSRCYPPIVVFRGSEEDDDWWVNIDTTQEQSRFQDAPSSVYVHGGFQSALFDQSVMTIVAEKILELVGDSSEVIVTGHSQGGAYAHLNAVYLSAKYPNMNVNMINFGAPRVGNEEFKSWTEGTLTNLSAWRIVNDNDIVPRIPTITGFGYNHAGHLIDLTDGIAKAYYHQIGGGDYIGAPQDWYYANGVDEHYLLAYRAALENFFTSSTIYIWPNEFELKSINGEGCSLDDDCESGYCTFSFQCAEKLEDGVRCVEDDDCKSNNCSWSITGKYCS